MVTLFLCIGLFLPGVVFGKDYFTAAVFEHRPRFENLETASPLEIVSTNLKFYEKAAALAVLKGADIILFNEYGTFPYPPERDPFKNFAENIPDPTKHKFNPCTEKATDRHVLFTLSCLARKNNIYVVGNLIDIHKCDASCHADGVEGCSSKCSDGVNMYNTNAAFDPEGNLIARYHKIHPYFELVDAPGEAELITFDTPFGKFGLIVCFDSVFPEAVQLVKEYGIDTMLFPTYWYDDIVLWNAVEWQQSWAIANNVNFFGANIQYPKSGSIGSGIYSKSDGALVYTYEPDGLSKLLVANVRITENAKVPEKSSVTVITEDDVYPKVETGDKFEEHCYEKVVGPAKDFLDYRCFKNKLENYTLVKLEDASGKLQACSNGFCCSLSYSARDMHEDFYLAVFKGLNNVEGFYHWSEETCVVVRCDPFEGKPCALQPSTSKTVFQSVELKAQFSSEYIYPTVSKSKFRLAPKKEWQIKKKSDKTKLSFRTECKEPFLKAGMMARNYEKDPQFVPFF